MLFAVRQLAQTSQKGWMSFDSHWFFDKISTPKHTPSSLASIPAQLGRKRVTDWNIIQKQKMIYHHNVEWCTTLNLSSARLWTCGNFPVDELFIRGKRKTDIFYSTCFLRNTYLCCLNAQACKWFTWLAFPKIIGFKEEEREQNVCECLRR